MIEIDLIEFDLMALRQRKLFHLVELNPILLYRSTPKIHWGCRYRHRLYCHEK